MKVHLNRKQEAGTVRITHEQAVKSSLAYQTAEARYGISFQCKDTPLAIEATIRRAEQVVNGYLAQQVEKQRRSLALLAEQGTKEAP